MSARPSILQFLQHGKILCGKVFAGFVETWNYLVEGFDNIKGDADLDPQSGIVTVDRSDATHLVIRLLVDRLPAFSNSGGAVAPGCYELSGGYLANQYYAVGGNYHTTSYSASLAQTTGIVYLRMNATGSSAGAAVGTCADWSAFQALVAADTVKNYFYKPLYQLTAGEVTVDFRNMPSAAMVEF